MTNTYSTEAQLLQNTPKEFPNAAVSQGRLKRSRNTITMAAQASADTITCSPLPIGHIFAFGILNASATLGSSTLAIGKSGSAAFYRAAATFTGAVATMFGLSPAADDEPATAEVTPIITIGAASLPGSGVLVVDFYYSQAS